MSTVERSVPVVQKVQAQGLGGMWEEIKEKVGDLKTNLFTKISEYLIPTIITAGITWIISLLNPASAFVRAVKMIIDFVSFIINQGAQILEFVNSVLDAIAAIAGGAAAGIPALIEKALARSVPVLIGVLAAILGIGGLAQKAKKFFKALCKPIMKAVDWTVDKIVKFGKRIWAKLKAGAGKFKNKFGRKGPEAALPSGPATAKQERAAIADAERMLAAEPARKQAADQLPDIARRHGVPLRLVTDSTTSTEEVVHVQSMVTQSHTLPAFDPTALDDQQLWKIASFRTDGLTKTKKAQVKAAQSELAKRIGTTWHLIRHMAVEKPRQVFDMATEDAIGHAMNAHISARHVMGGRRIDLPHPALGTTVNEDWLAYRAVTNQPRCGGMSGAFANPGAARTAVQTAADKIMSDWPKFREQLLRSGSVQQITSASASGICFVRTSSVPSTADLPTWLGGPTNRKLHRGDTRATVDPPLADSGPPGGVEVRIVVNQDATNGWSIHSAWPTI